MRRLFLCLILLILLAIPVNAETIRWVDFQVPYESLHYALQQDIQTSQQEKHVGWIEILSLAACRTGGKCPLSSVKKAAADLKGEESPQELLGANSKYYDYYFDAYTAALGGLVGSYAIEINGEWKS